MLLNPQGHGNAPELSPVRETKDSRAGKRAPRCRASLAKRSEERGQERGQRTECCLSRSSLQNEVVPHGEGRGQSCLGKAEETLKGLKSKVISEEQIDFHSLEQRDASSFHTGKHEGEV